MCHDLQRELLELLPQALHNEYLSKYCTAMYQFNRGNTNEVKIDSTRKVSEIYDQTLTEMNSVNVNVNNKPTLCSKNDRINNRFYLTIIHRRRSE